MRVVPKVSSLNGLLWYQLNLLTQLRQLIYILSDTDNIILTLFECWLRNLANNNGYGRQLCKIFKNVWLSKYLLLKGMFGKDIHDDMLATLGNNTP